VQIPRGRLGHFILFKKTKGIFMSMETYLPPNRQLSLKAVAFLDKDNTPISTRSGWLLAQMHLAGSNVAAGKAGGTVEAHSINELVFYEPVHDGDEVSYYAEVIHMNHNTLTLQVEAWAHRPSQTDDVKITEGCFIFLVDGNNPKSSSALS
jgi:acyl-CoA thioesterase YciA